MPGWKYAFSLSGEALKAATPPGTVVLIEHSATKQNGQYVDRVVKYPIPTDDPADPLNWPSWRKVVCMVSVSLYAFVANYISASMAPALPLWNHAFPHDRRPIKDLMGFVAFNVLVLGLGNIIWVPLSNAFGRRLILVLSSLVLLAATACGIPFAGFTATLFIRMFQGFGSSASETVVPAVVGDLFFVHERGGWMAFYTASLASGSVVGGITGGYIAHELGWARQFWIGTGLAGLAFVATFFFVPETMFDRGKYTLPVERTLPRASQYAPRVPSLPPPPPPPPPPPRSRSPRLSLMTLPSMRFTLPSRFHWPLAGDRHEVAQTWYETSSSLNLPEGCEADVHDHDNGPSQSNGSGSGSSRNTSNAPPPLPPPPCNTLRSAFSISTASTSGSRTNSAPSPPSSSGPYTFVQSLGFPSYKGHLVHHFVKPWTTLRLPATWVIMLQYGGLVGGVAVISTVGPQILTHRPYRWGEHAGLLFVGALVGIVLGGLWTGLMVDRRVKKLARDQDHGYAEPEARVVVMVPSLVVGTGGLLVFGFCAQEPSRFGWVGLECAYGMVAFALAQVPSVWFGYLIDSYNQLASDCFVMICILRGLVPFGWTFFVAQWVEKDGFLIPFGGFTAILGSFALLIIPVIFWGKRMRIATARYVVANQ